MESGEVQEWTTCPRKNGKGRVCNKPVFLPDCPIRKNCRDGKRIILCATCLKHRTDELTRCRETPTEKYIEKTKRGNAKQKGTQASKEKSKRNHQRKQEEGSMREHNLVADNLRNIIRKDGDNGIRFLQVSCFSSQNDVRDWFRDEAKRCGFAGGLEDYGNGAGKWTIAHKIPKHAYDGTDPLELAKCWDKRNMSCSTKSANSRQGRVFDEFTVPSVLFPKDWGGLPCTQQRREEITKSFAHVDTD